MGLVTITYTNATFTANVANIVVGSGGAFVLTQNQSLALNGSFTFSGFTVTTGAISFENTSQGVAVSGTVAVQINATQGDPQITANNFSGSATVSWPSSGTGGFEALTPGVSITLTDFEN